MPSPLTGTSKVRRIDGQATADFNQMVQKSLTPTVLRLREIEASKAVASSPNAKLVLMGGAGAHTLLDLRGGKDAPYP